MMLREELRRRLLEERSIYVAEASHIQNVGQGLFQEVKSIKKERVKSGERVSHTVEQWDSEMGQPREE